MRTTTRALGLALLAIPAIGNPCLGVGPDGKPISVTSESAVIAWDPMKHEEQFIRSANFETDADSIGFLVPTPAEPKLTEAKDGAFRALLGMVTTRLRSQTYGGEPAAGAKAAGPRDPVISVSHVGGFEETVLSLTDKGAVESWLAKHHFAKTADGGKWLDYYARMGWVVTAFRFEAKDGFAGLKPVTMTFHTDQPFYPYKEPATKTDEPGVGRSLRVYFLSNGPFDATLAGQPWIAKREVCSRLSDKELDDLKPLLPGVSLDKSTWLTSFKDDSSPRIGSDDVFFRPSKETPVWPIVSGLLLALVVLMGWRLRSGRRMPTLDRVQEQA